MRIRTKLLIFLLALVLPPLIVVSTYAVWESQNLGQKLADGAEESLVRTAKQRLQLSLAVMEVQQTLLPREAPVLPGLDIAAASVFCDATGGDYYDFLTSAAPDGPCYDIVIGDATGHGIAAALLMQHIPRSTNGVDKIAAKTSVNLGTQSADIGFHDVGLGVEMKFPDFFKKHCSGYDPVGIAHEVFQQFEFQGLQIQITASPSGGTGQKVQLQIGDFQLCGHFRQWRASRECLYPGHQFRKRERFDQIVVATGFQAFDPLFDATARRQKEDRCLDACSPDCFDQGQTVKPGQHSVNNHEHDKRHTFFDSSDAARNETCYRAQHKRNNISERCIRWRCSGLGFLGQFRDQS